MLSMALLTAVLAGTSSSDFDTIKAKFALRSSHSTSGAQIVCVAEARWLFSSSTAFWTKGRLRIEMTSQMRVMASISLMRSAR